MTGRPTLYSEELAERICEQLMRGLSLVKICDAEGMPDRVTVTRWLGKNEAFATQYARARETQADYMDDLILDVAAGVTPESANADRVRLAAYQWRAAKLAPKKYGDKLALAGHDGGALSVSVVRFTEAAADVAPDADAAWRAGVKKSGPDDK